MLLFISRESIREIIEDAGCEIWYLPAYFPDLNKRCDLGTLFQQNRERAPRQLSARCAEVSSAYRIALLRIGGLF